MIKHIPYPRLLDFYMRFRIRTVASVIDVGAGIRPMSWFVPTTHIVIEPHAEYIDRLHQTHPHIIAWHTTAQEALPTVQDGAVDSVFIMDCLEYVSKDDGYIILRNANRIAREQVVVFTPIGFFPQPESEVDGWGLHGGAWQVHRSGWTPDELASFEFDCYTCQTYHSVDAHGTRLARPVGAFYAVRDVSRWNLSPGVHAAGRGSNTTAGSGSMPTTRPRTAVRTPGVRTTARNVLDRRRDSG